MAHTLDFTTITTFDIYDWSPDATISIDENFLDVALMVCRTSVCVQGLMGCIFVKPLPAPHVPADLSAELTAEFYLSAIIASSINTPFYKVLTSDIHAEINAISACSRAGIATEKASAYISMPPCKDCFQALIQAGVRRIVSRKNACEAVVRVAGELGGVTLVDLKDSEESIERRLRIVRNSGRGKTEEQIKEERKKRKEYSIREKSEKKAKKLAMPMQYPQVGGELVNRHNKKALAKQGKEEAEAKGCVTETENEPADVGNKV